MGGFYQHAMLLVRLAWNSTVQNRVSGLCGSIDGVTEVLEVGSLV